MGWLRSCYSCKMQFNRIGEEPRILDVVWYWADEDAPIFYGPNVFYSRNWELSYDKCVKEFDWIDPEPKVGELANPRVYHNGDVGPCARNGVPIGAADLWEQGCLPDSPLPEIDPETGECLDCGECPVAYSGVGVRWGPGTSPGNYTDFTGSAYSLPLRTPYWDTDNYYSASNPTRLTAPKDGLYQVNWTVKAQYAFCAVRAALRRSGTSTLEPIPILGPGGNAFGAIQSHACVWTVPLLAGEYLEFQVQPNPSSATGRLYETGVGVFPDCPDIEMRFVGTIPSWP